MITTISVTITMIAAIYYTWSAARLNKLNRKLFKELKLLEYQVLSEIQIVESLHDVHLESKLLNQKMQGQIQFWKYRRKLLEKVPTSFRKKKIRGKRRKSGR